MSTLKLHGLYDSGEDGAVCCPTCDDFYVHLESVQVDALGDVTRVDHSGVHSSVRDRDYVRGSVVWILFACENGHRFAARFQFHKGAVLHEVRVLKPFNRDEDSSWPECLPRD